jgi:PPOX class probable F420-dependent enzyme
VISVISAVGSGPRCSAAAFCSAWLTVLMPGDRGKVVAFPGQAGTAWGTPLWWRCDHVLVPDNTLSWPEAAARLAAARNYWLCTTKPSGAPHAAPVWGVVTGQVLYLYSERRTVKARNLAADPRVVVHLESGEDVLILRGTATDLGTPAQAPHVVAALSAKYTGEEDGQYLPDADPDFDVIYAISPQSALMWRLADYEDSQRRWTC